MSGAECLLEVILVVLLAATMFYAGKLQRALGSLRRDRATLEQMIANFNDSTRSAEDGIDRMRSAAEQASRDITCHIERVNVVRQDLLFLIDRGERAADKLEVALRQEAQTAVENRRHAASKTAIEPAISPVRKAGPAASSPEASRSRAERDLLRALRLGAVGA